MKKWRQKMNRAKCFLLLGMVLCCLPVSSLPRTGLAQALSKAVITYPGRNIFFADLYIAQARNFFREEGLDVRLVQVRPDLAMAAAMSGEVQAVSNVATAIRAIERGNVPFRILSVALKRPLFWLVARPEYKSIPELKGKFLGIPSRSSAPHVAATRLLRKGGLDPEKDITLIITADQLKSLASGTIQAAALTVPLVILARDKFKMNILASAMEEFPSPESGVAVPDNVLREQRDVVKRILRAEAKARRHFFENERSSAEVLADYLKIELSVALESYRLARSRFTTNGIPTGQEIREYLKMDVEAMGLPRPVPADRIFDFSLQREVNRELGIR
jgi:ABC-type nitrate/sulfonate/bicarbonate transport system substrate-binding protein